MKTQLKEILDTLYEAEGLIELALGRDRETMARIALLVKSKCFHAADLASLIPDAEKEAETPGTEVKEATAEVPVGSDAKIDVVIGDSGLAVTTTTGPDDAEKLFMEKVAPKIAPAPAEDKNTEMADDPEAEAEHEESDAIRTEQEEELNHTESESASEPETESDSGQEISDTEEAAAQMVAEDLEAELRGDVKARTTPGFEQRAESDASMFADAAEFEEAEDAGEEPKARASQMIRSSMQKSLSKLPTRHPGPILCSPAMKMPPRMSRPPKWRRRQAPARRQRNRLPGNSMRSLTRNR